MLTRTPQGAQLTLLALERLRCTPFSPVNGEGIPTPAFGGEAKTWWRLLIAEARKGLLKRAPESLLVPTGE